MKHAILFCFYIFPSSLGCIDMMFQHNGFIRKYNDLMLENISNYEEKKAWKQKLSGN